MESPAPRPAKIYVIIGLVVLVFLFLLLLIISRIVKDSSQQANGTPTAAPETRFQITETPAAPSDRLAMVGKETLYKADLDYQKSLYAGDATAIQKMDFVNKLVKDSITLQAGAAAGYITLETSYFNAPDKNYILRQKNIQHVKDTVQAESKSITGFVVSIWFANDVPPAIGYAKAKEVALQKITALQQDVTSGKLTMQQAAAQIKADTSLASLDQAYKVNAIFTFEKKAGEQITISKELDTALWKQPVNGVTNVVLVKSQPTFDTKEIDAVYMFGQVTQKDDAKTISNFDTWFTQQQPTYAVTLY